MSILPVRNLSELGIIKDRNPFDLPLNAFSGGTNVRFDNGKAMRSPVFRLVLKDLPAVEPWFCVGLRPSTGFDSVFIGDTDGSLHHYATGGVENVTERGFQTINSNTPWTSAFLGDVLYLNRPTHVPRFWGPGSHSFAPLPGWDSGWRAQSVRAFKDFLIALNLTKGAVAHPTLVKWSDLTLAGQPPASWDANDDATSAGETPLAEMDGPIIDGLSLRNIFIIYGESQVWMMEHVGGQLIFNFRKVFHEGGIINKNCVVEVNGKHYVFGKDDIYVHDGTNKQSISDERVKDFIFRSMNNKLCSRFFVQHNPNLNEIIFAYVSGDTDAKFINPTRCNKAAVYNYANETWGFIDLPNISSMTLSNIDHVFTYENANARYDLVGGSYYDQEDSLETHVTGVSAPLPASGLTGSKLLGLDSMDNGALTYELDLESYAPAYVERVGLDLDTQGAGLGDFKLCRRLYPQVTTFRNIPLQIQIGASEAPSGNVKWEQKQSFNPHKQYKIDTRSSGRYIAVRFFVDKPADFEISGFDADIVSGGRR